MDFHTYISTFSLCMTDLSVETNISIHTPSIHKLLLLHPIPYHLKYDWDFHYFTSKSKREYIGKYQAALAFPLKLSLLLTYPQFLRSFYEKNNERMQPEYFLNNVKLFARGCTVLDDILLCLICMLKVCLQITRYWFLKYSCMISQSLTL